MFDPITATRDQLWCMNWSLSEAHLRIMESGFEISQEDPEDPRLPALEAELDDVDAQQDFVDQLRQIAGYTSH